MQFDNGLPIYLQIVKEMTLRALSGAIEPGGKIPPVRELAAEFGVNPNTMQRAMAEMISEVRVARINGEFVINPTFEQLEKADMDLMVGATYEIRSFIRLPSYAYFRCR